MQQFRFQLCNGKKYTFAICITNEFQNFLQVQDVKI